MPYVGMAQCSAGAPGAVGILGIGDAPNASSAHVARKVNAWRPFTAKGGKSASAPASLVRKVQAANTAPNTTYAIRFLFTVSASGEGGCTPLEVEFVEIYLGVRLLELGKGRLQRGG